jgi:hypothetical protein
LVNWSLLAWITLVDAQYGSALITLLHPMPGRHPAGDGFTPAFTLNKGDR